MAKNNLPKPIGISSPELKEAIANSDIKEIQKLLESGVKATPRELRTTSETVARLRKIDKEHKKNPPKGAKNDSKEDEKKSETPETDLKKSPEHASMDSEKNTPKDNSNNLEIAEQIHRMIYENATGNTKAKKIGPQEVAAAEEVLKKKSAKKVPYAIKIGKKDIKRTIAHVGLSRKWLDHTRVF